MSRNFTVAAPPPVVLPDILSTDPIRHYFAFTAAVNKAAAQHLPHMTKFGLLSLTMETTAYRLYTGNDLPPDFPHPGDLDEEATSAVQQTHATALRNYQEYQLAYTALRTQILAAAGPHVEATFLCDRSSHLCLDDIKTIMARLKDKFGTTTAAEIKRLKQTLTVPLTAGDSSTVRLFFADRQRTIDILQHTGYAIPDMDQVDQIIDCCDNRFPHITAAIDKYRGDCTNPTDQTPGNLIERISARADNEAPIDPTLLQQIPHAMLALGHSTATDKPSLPSPQQEPFVAAIASLAAAVAALNRPQRSKGSSQTSPATDMASYCFFHGPGKHSSAECIHMSRHTDKFTPAMRSALSPTEVPGGRIKPRI